MRSQFLSLFFAFAVFSASVAVAQEPTENKRRGLLKRIFANPELDQTRHPAPRKYDWQIHDVYTDRESDTIDARIDPYKDTGASANRDNDPVKRYPHIPGYNTLRNGPQHEIEELIDDIYASYECRIDRMSPPDLSSTALSNMGSVPTSFETVWRDLVRVQIWESQRCTPHSIEDIYMRTLEYSNQIKVFSDIPLIRETGMQEADGEFDPVFFMDTGVIRRNEPSGSSLVTGSGIGRFKENEEYFETGMRRKFLSGAEATVSNRWSHLDNNSTFLRPNNQGSSEFVMSVTQPLLEGAGYHYNHSKIKIAKFDARMASSEFVRQLQAHLLEVNRAYWSLYYARSSYLLHKQLVSETSNVLEQLEDRADLDALESEVLRARAALATRKSFLNRSEVAIRNSEERLRAMVNDPDQDIGSNAETIPMTLPVLASCLENVQKVAKDALHNRPEIQQGFDQLRAAVVRRDMQKNEKWPTLNLVAELMLGDIRSNDDSTQAFRNQWGDPGYQVGLQFEHAIDNDEARAKLLRREIELRQQANQLKTTIDTVLLESVVSYRELITAYRDMIGKYETLNASREELRQLRDRLEVDTEEEGGRTTASQLQIILDSMDRNQNAEEAFLDAVVAYNASFAGLERAKGTILRKENIEIERVRDTDPTHQCDDVEKLKLSMTPQISGAKSGKGSTPVYNARYAGPTYGVAKPHNTSIDSFRSLTEPEFRERRSADDVINESINAIETIPLQDIPLRDLPSSSDSDLMPIQPVAPSVNVKPLRSAKPALNKVSPASAARKLSLPPVEEPSATVKPISN